MSSSRQIASFSAPEFFLDTFVDEKITNATIVKDERPGITVILEDSTQFRVAAKYDKYGDGVDLSVSHRGDESLTAQITEFMNSIDSSIISEWVAV